MRFILPTLTIGMLLAARAAAGDDGLSGHWKFSFFPGVEQQTLWLLHLDSKDGKLTASADPLKGAPQVTVEQIKIDGETFTMKLKATLIRQGQKLALTFDYEGKLPKPGAKKIFGSLTQGGETFPAVLEATQAKNTFGLDRDVLLKTPSDPRALSAVLELIDRAKENKVAAKDLQDWVDLSLRSSESYGPRLHLNQQIRLLTALQDQEAYAAVALATARKISNQIDPKAPLDAKVQLLTAVAGIFEAGKQKDEARAVEVRIDKLEEPPYAEYAKTALNYKIEKYAGRKTKGNRPVLLELFTGPQCPPCVAADMAFDGVEKTYGPGDVVLLQYHVHIPRPDPMSTKESRERLEFYADNYKKVGGTPASIFNGKPTALGGGFRDDAADKYKEFCEAINRLLEDSTPVKLQAKASRVGDKISIQAKVEDVGKPGEQIRLRFALVEDWVRYKGSNGLQYHHRVVRAMPGGAKGIGLKEKGSEHKASIDLGELRKSLNDYLEQTYDGPRPLRLRHLSVVAFVQNDDSTEVLQAVNVPVRAE